MDMLNLVTSPFIFLSFPTVHLFSHSFTHPHILSFICQRPKLILWAGSSGARFTGTVPMSASPPRNFLSPENVGGWLPSGEHLSVFTVEEKPKGIIGAVFKYLKSSRA